MNYKKFVEASAALFRSSRKLGIPVFALIILIAPVQAQNDLTSIHQVVVIFQENRTPDNLFHDPKADCRKG